MFALIIHNFALQLRNIEMTIFVGLTGWDGPRADLMVKIVCTRVGRNAIPTLGPHHLEVKPNSHGYNNPSSNHMLVWSFKQESGSSLWPPKTTFASLDSETRDASLCRLLNRMRRRFSWADPTAKIVVCIGVGRSAIHPIHTTHQPTHTLWSCIIR